MTASIAAYDSKFMEYQSQSSAYAARAVTQVLARMVAPSSALDVGCATGTWLRAWQEAGVDDVQGVDGEYVSRSQLVVPETQFLAADLSKPLSLGRTFDLVQSLEVAEHIPTAAADQFVNNLVSHASRFILFSAAPPGQGGEHHVNEQTYDYWRERFAASGYAAYDCVRPAISSDMNISFWYRYNVLLYVNLAAQGGLAAEVVRTALPPRAPVPDVSPWAFRLRKSIVRRLPYGVRDGLARFKARWAPTGRF